MVSSFAYFQFCLDANAGCNIRDTDTELAWCAANSHYLSYLVFVYLQLDDLVLLPPVNISSN